MRVLALFDVHGNPDALGAVLADPAVAGADAVVVGGDVVPGPYGPAVLDRLSALEIPTHWLRGNGEREVAAAAGEDPSEDVLHAIAVASAATLAADVRARLAALPQTVTLDGVLYCHATPRSDEEMLTRLSPDERYAAALEGVDARLVVAGHTHQQHERLVGEVRFVNAGSVGLPYEGDGAARWLLVEDGVPRFGATAYDARAAGERMLADGWPDARSLNASLIEPLPAEVITELFEAGATGER